MSLLKEFFRPIDNRHFVGQKRHLKLYLLGYLPIAFLFAFLMVTDPGWDWIVFASAIAALGLIDYFVFDRLIDRLLWKYVFRRHYQTVESESTQAIKAYQSDPSFENLERIKETLGGKNG